GFHRRSGNRFGLDTGWHRRTLLYDNAKSYNGAYGLPCKTPTQKTFPVAAEIVPCWAQGMSDRSVRVYSLFNDNRSRLRVRSGAGAVPGGRGARLDGDLLFGGQRGPAFEHRIRQLRQHQLNRANAIIIARDR